MGSGWLASAPQPTPRSSRTTGGWVRILLTGRACPDALLHLQLHHQQVTTSFSWCGRGTERSDSAQFEALTQLLPEKALPLQVASPADAFLAPCRLRREELEVRPDSHPP